MAKFTIPKATQEPQEETIIKRDYSLPEVIDGSFIKTKMSCLRKAYFNHVLHLRPGTKPAPLGWGGAFHDAVDWWVKEEKPTGEAAEDRAVQIFLDAYQYDGEDKRTPKLGEQRVRGYIRTYRNEPFKTIRSEIGFAIPLPGTDFLWGGRIDRLIRWMGSLYILDTKTTGRMGSRWMSAWDMDISLTGYTWGAGQIMGEQCTGILIDGVSTAKKPRSEYLRDITNRTPWQKDEFIETAIDEINDWISRLKAARNGEDPLRLFHKENTSWTCRFCDYRKLCQSHASERMMKNEYRREVWHPFNIIKESGETIIHSSKEPSAPLPVGRKHSPSRLERKKHSLAKRRHRKWLR